MTEPGNPAVRPDPADNVVTAIRPLAAGAKGAPVLKYAQVIGYAAQDIRSGDHVHSHNLAFRNTGSEGRARQLHGLSPG